MGRRGLAEQGPYLDRLGETAEAPSAEALARLHRAHVERVPWETLWIHQGKRWGSDPAESVTRIATTTRGGYCFHLNGAFAALLESLGYAVTRHVGGVHGPLGPGPADMTNHLALMVHHLPTDGNPGGRWYVDVGLGDALLEPMPLQAGSHHHDPFQLRLDQVEHGLGDWHLTHDEHGSFAGMTFSASPTEMETFVYRHRWLSTSPESAFVRNLVLQRRDPGSVVVLRNLILRRTGAGACDLIISSSDELFDVLGKAFGIDAGPIGAQARATIWNRASTAHAEWVAQAAGAGH
jgi:arylamine N-acetyltransferase